MANPCLPIEHLSIQKANGVQLYDTVNKAREFVQYLASAVQRKISGLVCRSTGFSVLFDGSQARKTGKEKEHILVRTMKDGKPVFLTAGLQNIDDYGDANAVNLKRVIDDTFIDDLAVHQEIYCKRLVSATSDGTCFGQHRCSQWYVNKDWRRGQTIANQYPLYFSSSRVGHQRLPIEPETISSCKGHDSQLILSHVAVWQVSEAFYQYSWSVRSTSIQISQSPWHPIC